MAFNLEALQKGIGNLVERLGCRPCFSGADCTFLHERDFLIDEKLEVIGRFASGDPIPARGLPQDPVPDRRVTVSLPSSVSNDLKQVQGLVASIANKLGHTGCCSGFDVLFQVERELLMDEALNIRMR